MRQTTLPAAPPRGGYRLHVQALVPATGVYAADWLPTRERIAIPGSR